MQRCGRKRPWVNLTNWVVFSGEAEDNYEKPMSQLQPQTFWMKVKFTLERTMKAQRVSRGIALLFL
jgi:hypothetical protein